MSLDTLAARNRHNGSCRFKHGREDYTGHCKRKGLQLLKAMCTLHVRSPGLLSSVGSLGHPYSSLARIGPLIGLHLHCFLVAGSSKESLHVALILEG